MLLPAPQSSLPPRALYPRPTHLSSSTKYQLVSLFPAHNCMSKKTLYTIKKTKNPLSSPCVSLARSRLLLLALCMSSGEKCSVRTNICQTPCYEEVVSTTPAAVSSQQPTPRDRVEKPCSAERKLVQSQTAQELRKKGTTRRTYFLMSSFN